WNVQRAVLHPLRACRRGGTHRSGHEQHGTCSDAPPAHRAAARAGTTGAGISQGRGRHFERSVSFLNCELSTNSCVRYSGSSTTVVTMSHTPSSGSVKLSKNSLTDVRAL